MGRGRGRSRAWAACVGALALVARRLRRRGARQRTAARSRRPGSASRSRRSAITVQPPRIAFGPEPTQQIPQNQHAAPAADPHQGAARRRLRHRQPDPTSTRKLEIRGPKDATSGPLVANGNGTFQTALPTGTYTVSAADIPGAKPASSSSAPTAPPPRTTSCCRRSAALAAARRGWRLTRCRHASVRVTVVLAIAVVLLAAGARLRRSSRRRPEPQAPSSRPRPGDPGGRLAGGRRVAARPAAGSTRRRASVDAKTAEAALDKRQAEIKAPGRADRQGPGEDRGEVRAAAARPTCRRARCSSRWARPSATSTPRPPA